MFRILKAIKGNLLVWTIISALCIMIQATGDLLQPLFLGHILMKYEFMTSKTSSSDMTNYALIVGGIMLAVAVIGLIFGSISIIISCHVGVKLGQNVRGGLYRKIQTLSFADIEHFKTASLITRMTNDITKIQNVVILALRIGVRAVSLFAGAIIEGAIVYGDLAYIFAVLSPVIIVCIAGIAFKAIPYYRKAQINTDDVNLVMRENLLGVRVIKAFNLTKGQTERFYEKSKTLANTSTKAQTLTFMIMPIILVLVNVSIVAVLWMGGAAHIGNISLDIDAAKVVPFISLMTLMLMGLIMLIMIMINISQAQASAVRVGEVIDYEPSIVASSNPLPIANSSVEFKGVNFKYHPHGEDVLSDVSFTAKANTTIGIIGPTGSGKSTLVNLIARLYDITHGQILIGETNIKRISNRALRARIAMVLQNNTLFSGTIKSNMLYGKRDASRNELEKAAKAAEAWEFINTKEGKFDSEVEQRAKNLSGGQKQRLSIARALVKKPHILILDDCTSALDTITEAKVQRNLKEQYPNTTIFLVAQRISAVRDADKILVMDKGKIIASGKHNFLIRMCPLYKEIAASQENQEGDFDNE